MALVPLRYPLRSLIVRWRASLFSALGIGCTVAVFCAIMSLRNGIEQLYESKGSPDVLIYMRPGATSEGESAIRTDQGEILKKERPEVARDAKGNPLSSAESYLALFLDRIGGGETNVPLRGVEQTSFDIHGDSLRVVEGRRFTAGTDEIIVGRSVSSRIANAQIGKTLIINITPFKVVGIFENDGPYQSEIWGDVDRFGAALNRPLFQRVIAKLKPNIDIEALAKELEDDKRIPAKIQTERSYMNNQKNALGTVLVYLASLLSTIMGIAAVLGAMNTMLASVGGRTREVGILLSLGFGRFPIFLTFLIEACLIGMVGGVLGALMVLPFNGIETGTMNMQTFTEVAFAFRVDSGILLLGAGIATVLGILGGVVPAAVAARMEPCAALRRH
ncbi:MAG: putative ABC transport system permease protein [Planctomycetota bacterium]|jgi:putative ABC transport system permease protein